MTDLENEVFCLKVTVEEKEHDIKALKEENDDCLNRYVYLYFINNSTQCLNRLSQMYYNTISGGNVRLVVIEFPQLTCYERKQL